MSTLINIAGGGNDTLFENTLYVAKNGSDATGTRNNASFPFLTIGAAIAASLPGDAILVSPGTYDEEGLTLQGRTLIGKGGWEHTVLGVAPASATTHIVTLDSDAYIQGFGMNVPQTAFAAINCTQAGGTNSIYDISLYGDGGTGTSLGTGIIRQGGGKTIGANVRVEKGGIKEVFKNIQGVLALEGIHVPQSQGDIQDVLLVTTNDPTGVAPTVAGRAQFLGFNCGKGDNGPFGVGNGVVNIVRTEGGASGVIPNALVFTANFFNSTNAVAGKGQYERIEILGGRFENITGYSVVLDLLGNAQETVYRISANHQPVYLYNPLAAALSEFSLNFTQEQTNSLTSSYNIFGADQVAIGFAERGSDVAIGRGAPYTTGMKVLTTDNTAGPASDGGNFIDVTAAAESRVGSTFSFQTNVANETILVGTQRADIVGIPLFFYGIETFMDATSSPLSDIVAEIWDGAAWVNVNFHSVAEDRGYSYGNTVFWRADIIELVRFNVDENTSWATKTINGIAARWMRFRIVTPGASNPTIQRFRLIESSTNISRDGVLSSLGLSMFRKNISLNGPIWTGNSGGTALADVAENIGGVYTHDIRDSQFNTVGSRAMIQLPIPVGTCTAFPLELRLNYGFTNASANTINVGTPPQITTRVTIVKSSGTLVASTAGVVVPVLRQQADATNLSTVVPVATITDLIPEGATGLTPYNDLVNKLHKETLTDSIDISDAYEEDIILIELEYTQDDGTTSQDIQLWSLELLGVAHQDGKSI